MISTIHESSKLEKSSQSSKGWLVRLFSLSVSAVDHEEGVLRLNRAWKNPSGVHTGSHRFIVTGPRTKSTNVMLF